jgi:hypothetical protein
VTAASLSLLVVPFAPVYDAWAWLVWGRELAVLDLDTGAGPSWKPLPVFITAIASPAGDAAPAIWVVVARASWIAAALLAARLAARLLADAGIAGRRYAVVAAVTAAVGVVLMHDDLTPWLDQFSGALSEPLLAALILAAVDRDLSGRGSQALWLGFAATLIRPEAWPFLVAYALWLWRREPGTRALALALIVTAPVLWVVPDLIASGGLFTGAERALAGGSDFFEVLRRGLELPPAALWLGAALAVGVALRAGRRRLATLALGALAWTVVVAVAASLDFAGLARFLVPAGAIVCVLGGVGIATAARAAFEEAGGAARPRATAGLALVFLACLLVAQGAVRAADFRGQIDQAQRLEGSIESAFALVDEVGRERIVACGGQVVSTDLFTQTALAWKLDVGLGSVQLSRDELPSSGAVFIGPGAPADARARIATQDAEELGARGEWILYALDCDPVSSRDRIRAP